MFGTVALLWAAWSKQGLAFLAAWAPAEQVRSVVSRRQPRAGTLAMTSKADEDASRQAQQQDTLPIPPSAPSASRMRPQSSSHDAAPWRCAALAGPCCGLQVATTNTEAGELNTQGKKGTAEPHTATPASVGPPKREGIACTPTARSFGKQRTARGAAGCPGKATPRTNVCATR